MQTGLSYFRENLKKLPLDIREAIVNTDYLGALEEIQENKKLHIDQAASMEELTFRLILGELDTESFGSEISKALNIDSEKTNELVAMIDQKVMQPIRDEIQNIEDQRLLDEDAKNSVENKTPLAQTPPPSPAPENYANLTHHEILAEIENPQPSTAVQHETLIPARAEADSVPINKTTETESSSTSAPQMPKVQTQMPSGWPTPATPTMPAAAVTNTETPASQVASAFNQKLEQVTVSKPTEVRHSVDPYKEPIQ